MITKNAVLGLEHGREFIEPGALSDLTTRVPHVCQFINFQPDIDGPLIHGTRELINANLQVILDDIFSKLLSTNLTADVLALQRPKDMSDPDAPIPRDIDPEDLNLEHPQVLFRKKVLGGYFQRLVNCTDWSASSSIWTYIDRVGASHTGRPAFKEKYGSTKTDPLSIPYLHVGLQGSLMVEAIVDLVMSASTYESWTWDKKVDTVKAWNKLMWLQNDLYARHYIRF